MEGATETHIPLRGGKKNKTNICCKQILIIINHASVYSTVIILCIGALGVLYHLENTNQASMMYSMIVGSDM